MMQKFRLILKKLRPNLQFFLLTVGAILSGIGVALFIDPYEFAPGGVMGISVVLSDLIHVETGTLVACFNIPLLLLAFKKFKLRFALSTLYVIFLSSLTMNIIEWGKITVVLEERILAAVFGGIISAVGIGLAFHGGGSTGGTDIVVKTLRQKYKHLKTSFIFMLSDFTVIAISGIRFGVESILYACLCAVVTSTMLDLVLYGRDEARFVFIIASNPAHLSQRLLTEANVGVTTFTGVGAYSGVERQIMMCVFHKHLYPRVKSIVYEEDPGAFMIVTNASETYGKGFKVHTEEEL